LLRPNSWPRISANPDRRARANTMGLSYDEISEILKLIDGSSCDEFVLETEDIKLVVRRRGADRHPVGASEDPGTIFVRPSEPTPQPQLARATAHAGSGHAVSAPMVGTFYRSPSPGAPPFVKIGSKVKKGDPICIIEVMKLFTTITAEWSGTVKEIGAENGQLVEYGQMLFVIAPD
jgi:acetyl-CoA carboxylase biotin carboxyl carrier protein